MSTFPSVMNKAQLEILKILAREVSDDDLLAIKRLIVLYFAKKAIQCTNEVWDINGWTSDDENRLLQIHERTPYRPIQ